MEKWKEPIYITSPVLPELSNFTNQLEKIWESHILTNNGAMHKELEINLKTYLKVPSITLMSNGTIALLLGLKGLELSGEVIVTPFTFPATTEALDWLGLTPVFCDIESETYTIDVSKIESLITEKTSAILGVHVFGNICKVEAIQEIADRYNLKVIYDGAHAFGATYNNEPIGRFGDLTMFSFHATKLFNTIEGGGLVYRDQSLYERLYLLKNFGISGPENVVLSGLNGKLNEIQAAMGIEVLKLVESERLKRKEVQKKYIKHLDGIKGIRIINVNTTDSNSFQYFPIEVDEMNFGLSRDQLHNKLVSHNIISRKYFYPLCSTFEWYSDNKSADAVNLPVATNVVERVLCLPFYGDLDENVILYIKELFITK